MKNTITLIIVLFLLIGATRCKEKQADTAPAAVPVNVSTPLVKQVTEWDEYTGRFEAMERVEIRSRVSGSLDKVNFQDGQLVEKGQVLFIIDQRPFKIELQQAEAELKAATAEFLQSESNFRRVQSLENSRAISKEEYEQREQTTLAAKGRAEAAKARVDRAALNLDFTVITSPIKGRVSRKFVSVGNLITGDDGDGTLLTTVISLDPIHFYFEGSEADLLRYIRLDRKGERKGSREAANPVMVKLQDEADFIHEGKMDFVDNELDLGSGTIQGRAVLANPGYVIEAGMFGRAKLLGSGQHEALLIPEHLIQSDQTRRFVYVLSDSSTVAARVLTLGRFFDDSSMRAVEAGLEPGDELILNRLQFLRPGMKVEATRQPQEIAFNLP